MSDFDEQLFEDNIEIAEYLSSSRLFNPLPGPILQKLANISRITKHPPGDVILKEGEVNSNVYFLIRGGVGVYASNEYILSLKRMGDVFGEMSIISHKPCAATVITEVATDLFSISAKDIGEYAQVSDDPLKNVLFRVFAMILTEKLAITTHKAKHFEEANAELTKIKEELQKNNEILQHDIIEKQKTERELKQSHEKLLLAHQELTQAQSQLIQSAKLASIGELASGIVHELNQPLSYILTNVELELRNGTELNQQTAYETLQLTIEGIHRMMKIINHLRNFSRKQETHFESLYVEEVIDSSFILLKEQFRLANIEFEKSYAEPAHQITGDRHQLEQVFVNLFTNAHDAIMPNGHGKLTISTEFKQKTNNHGTVLISVTDDGHGIPEKILKHIFDPFFTTKDAGTGTGLGLSISYNIIQHHHGEITVKSKPKQGTTFEISLPST
ncbi:MAG: cyclic nucleotide-binding domain-containing protein [SAR324 cluster bacterium]|nr:cyclic nucleotide-binding domain-containing protein [SAR324 cluster bacterium]